MVLAFSTIPTYVTSAVALAVALWTAFRQREFSRFSLFIHLDTHNRLHLAFLNGGTQPSVVLQLLFAETVLPEVRDQIPPGSHYEGMKGGAANIWPLSHADEEGRAIAPLVVPPKTALTVTTGTNFLAGRPPLPVATPDGMQFLLALRIAVGSGDGRKVMEEIPLVRFADDRRSEGQPPSEPLVLIKPRLFSSLRSSRYDWKESELPKPGGVSAVAWCNSVGPASAGPADE